MSLARLLPRQGPKRVEALAGLGKLLKQTPKAKGTDRGGRSSKLGGSRVLPPNDTDYHGRRTVIAAAT